MEQEDSRLMGLSALFRWSYWPASWGWPEAV
jgi:hypothetical protein